MEADLCFCGNIITFSQKHTCTCICVSALRLIRKREHIRFTRFAYTEPVNLSRDLYCMYMYIYMYPVHVYDMYV